MATSVSLRLPFPNFALSSAAGFISLLKDKDTNVLQYALNSLLKIIDSHWPEISESISDIEAIYEDGGPHRHLAALLASKIFYHLGDLDDAMMYALSAGDLFDINSSSEYILTMLGKCIDIYTSKRVEALEQVSPNEAMSGVDSCLEAIVNKMFIRSRSDGKFKQAIGIALETRRLDEFTLSISQSDDVQGMLAYSMKLCMTCLDNRTFLKQALLAIVDLYRKLKKPDYLNIFQCLMFLNDAEGASDLLSQLLRGSKEDVMLAYQLAFDLYENATQQFIRVTIKSLKRLLAMDTKESEPSSSMADTKPGSSSSQPSGQKAERIFQILEGEIPINLHLTFLIKKNHSDMVILKNTKEAVRNSICHTATIIANAFMHCGTTCDGFLRNNLEWLVRATNWAKFTAASSLGVIHKGMEKQAMTILSSYLPGSSGGTSSYQDAGGLYALGLVFANHGESIMDYLLKQLKDAPSETVRHGACLALGLAAMGTQNQEVFDSLKFTLFLDEAVSGEAAGIGMGLVMLGSNNADSQRDMITYCKETAHEKIERGLCIGTALTMYGMMEQADSKIKQLIESTEDAILRRSGVFALGLAYAGTGNNKAIRKLLNAAVSDANPDVRRSAVMSIGFILFRSPEQCCSVVSLLSESYNPHVRAGAAWALGIACAGTGHKEAMNILEPLLKDSVGFVRQGALIACAIICIQLTEAICPKSKMVRDICQQMISDKHEDSLAKFGAILAQGIIDAGGRNVTISLQSRAGQNHTPTIVGLFVFSQFWYWFPLAHFLALAFTPTALVALNSDLQLPKVQFQCSAKLSNFSYPEPTKAGPVKSDRERVQTAMISLSLKSKSRARKHALHALTSQATHPSMSSPASSSASSSDSPARAKDKTEGSADADKADRPNSSIKVPGAQDEKPADLETTLLQNPCRVLPTQLRFIGLPEESSYRPLKPVSVGGFILMNYVASDPEELVEPIAVQSTPLSQEEPDTSPPQPFELTDDMLR